MTVGHLHLVDVEFGRHAGIRGATLDFRFNRTISLFFFHNNFSSCQD